jgi:hypothetical protein
VAKASPSVARFPSVSREISDRKKRDYGESQAIFGTRIEIKVFFRCAIESPSGFPLTAAIAINISAQPDIRHSVKRFGRANTEAKTRKTVALIAPASAFCRVQAR